MPDKDPPPNTDSSFRTRLDHLLELIVGSSLGAAIIYSLFWGAFQSLAVGHYILNEERFVAASSNFVPNPIPGPNPPPAKAKASASSDDSDNSAGDVGDVIEIWYASAKHRSLLHPCQVDFEFTGKNLTNYKFGSDRRANPGQAKYLPILGLEKSPKLPGPFIYLHFESALGSTHSYQLPFDFKKDQAGNMMDLPPDKETFVAATSASLNPWECISTVFISGGFKITDFSDFNFIKAGPQVTTNTELATPPKN